MNKNNENIKMKGLQKRMNIGNKQSHMNLKSYST